MRRQNLRGIARLATALLAIGAALSSATDEGGQQEMDGGTRGPRHSQEDAKNHQPKSPVMVAVEEAGQKYFPLPDRHSKINIYATSEGDDFTKPVPTPPTRLDKAPIVFEPKADVAFTHGYVELKMSLPSQDLDDVCVREYEDLVAKIKEHSEVKHYENLRQKLGITDVSVERIPDLKAPKIQYNIGLEKLQKACEKWRSHSDADFEIEKPRYISFIEEAKRVVRALPLIPILIGAIYAGVVGILGLAGTTVSTINSHRIDKTQDDLNRLIYNSENNENKLKEAIEELSNKTQAGFDKVTEQTREAKLIGLFSLAQIENFGKATQIAQIATALAEVTESHLENLREMTRTNRLPSGILTPQAELQILDMLLEQWQLYSKEYGYNLQPPSIPMLYQAPISSRVIYNEGLRAYEITVYLPLAEIPLTLHQITPMPIPMGGEIYELSHDRNLLVGGINGTEEPSFISLADTHSSTNHYYVLPANKLDECYVIDHLHFCPIPPLRGDPTNECAAALYFYHPDFKKACTLSLSKRMHAVYRHNDRLLIFTKEKDEIKAECDGQIYSYPIFGFQALNLIKGCQYSTSKGNFRIPAGMKTKGPMIDITYLDLTADTLLDLGNFNLADYASHHLDRAFSPDVSIPEIKLRKMSVEINGTPFEKFSHTLRNSVYFPFSSLFGSGLFSLTSLMLVSALIYFLIRRKLVRKFLALAPLTQVNAARAREERGERIELAETQTKNSEKPPVQVVMAQTNAPGNVEQPLANEPTQNDLIQVFSSPTDMLALPDLTQNGQRALPLLPPEPRFTEMPMSPGPPPINDVPLPIHIPPPAVPRHHVKWTTRFAHHTKKSMGGRQRKALRKKRLREATAARAAIIYATANPRTPSAPPLHLALANHDQKPLPTTLNTDPLYESPDH